MEIEFTVVKTEVLNGKVKPEPIEDIKKELIMDFGGLTVQECKGYWLDGILYEDVNESWLILTDKEVHEEAIETYAERLRVATNQLAQLYRINHKAYLIDRTYRIMEPLQEKMKIICETLFPTVDANDLKKL